MYAEFEEIKRRLADIKTRGIVIHDKASLYDIYTERLPLYEKYADIKIDCTGRRIEETVEYLVREIRRFQAPRPKKPVSANLAPKRVLVRGRLV